MENKNVIGRNPHFVKLDEKEAVDIDTTLEFNFAEFLYNSI